MLEQSTLQRCFSIVLMFLLVIQTPLSALAREEQNLFILPVIPQIEDSEQLENGEAQSEVIDEIGLPAPSRDNKRLDRERVIESRLNIPIDEPSTVPEVELPVLEPVLDEEQEAVPSESVKRVEKQPREYSPVFEKAFIPAQYLPTEDLSSQDPGPALESTFVSGRVLVKLASPEALDRLETLGKYDLFTIYQDSQPLVRIDSPQGDTVLDLLETFYRDPDVIYVEPDYVYELDAVPNDAGYASQWGHKNTGASYGGFSGTAGEDIQSEDAWDITTGTGQTILAVIDTGVMLNHPDLSPNLWDGSTACLDENGVSLSGGCPHSGFDYFDYDNNPSDESTHGTRVAGVAAARGNNGIGIVGVNWQGKIMALKAGTADSNSVLSSAVASSIYFAVRNGAKVINGSFSGSQESLAITNALSFARTNGVLYVASAGNLSLDLDQPGSDAYPCETNLDNIICVASTNQQGTLEFFGAGGVTSNYGASAVDVGAPGSQIYTTSPTLSTLYGNTFESGSGGLSDFTLSGGSNWGLSTGGGNTLLKTHVSGVYGNNESSTVEINQNFDLSAYQAGTLFFEMSCDTDNALDINGFPLDGVAVELSHDGGLNYTEALALNGLLTTARGTFDKGAHGLPQITVGLIDEDFTNQFRFRFHFFSDAQNTGVGCQIDDVTLRVVSGSEYIFISGTSYASAVVAGLASLLWDYRPALSAAAMKNLILTTGENLPALSGKTVTGKRINAFLAFASSYDPAVVDLRGFVSSGGTEFFDGNTIPTASPYFSWTAPTGQGTITGYLYAVDGTPSGSVTTTSTFVSLSGLGEGAHTFSVVGVNSIGSQGTVRNFAFTVDTVAPPAPTNFSVNGGTNVVNASNVSSTSISVTVGENGTFNYRFSDGAHPNVSGSQAVTAGNVSVTGLNLSGLNEGALSLVVSLADAVGNTSSDVTRSVQKNSVAPVVTDGSISISGGTGTGGAYIVGNTLVVKWDNSVSGNNNPDVASVFANLSGWGGGSSVAMTDTSSCGGVAADQRYEACLVLTPGLIDATGVNASVKVDDVAGNSISTSDTTNAVVDTKVPVFTSSGLTIAVDNGVSGVAAVNGGTTVADQVKVNAALSVADGDTITWNASPIGGLAAVTNGVTVTVLAGSTDNAAQSFSVVATDNAGNMTAMSSQAIDGKTIAIDNTIPVLTSSGLTIAVDNGVSGVAAVNGGSTPADQVRVNATVAVIDGDTITWDATPIAGGGTITNGTTVTLLPGSTENSAQTFSIRVMDNAGNVVVMSSQAIDGKTISVDNVIPASPSSLVLNGGNTIIASQVSSVILQGFTAQPGLLMYAIIDSQSGSQNWAENVSGGAFSTTPRNLSAFAEGILQVFATIQDNAGNISSSGQTTGVKDTQGSAVTGVQLNGGQVINAAVQGSVNLVFTAGETGTAYWAIHDGVNSVTGSRVVSSVGLQTVSSLDLSGLADGTLSIEISFTDLAGNVSSLATSTAQKDTIAATLTNFSFNGGNVVNASVQSSVTMSFQASEMGTLTYIISDVGNVHSVSSAAPIPVGVVSPQVFSTTVNVTSLNDGSLSISLSFTDNVGNVRVASESAQKNSIGPLVTDGSISISGGTGTGGAYIVGNTLVVKWDNSVSGNNNPDVASVFANLSGWGGGSSVAMTDTSSCGGVAADQRYEACLVLTPGLIDATGVNASVKVDDVAGNSTSTSDTTNAVVDTKVPVFTSSGLTIAVDNGVSGVAAVNGGSISADKVRVNAALAVTDGDTITWNAGPIGGGSTITNGAMVTVLAGATKNSAQFFALRVADNAGNTLLTDTNAVDGKTISVDNVIPAAPSSLVLNGGIPITSSSLMSVVLTGVTGEAGLLMVAVVGFGGYAENWSQAVTGGPFSLSPHNFTAFADGSLQVYATIQDDAGNLSSDGQTTGTKDTGVSALQNVSLNGGNLISSSQQNSVQLRFQATEAGTLTYQVENTGGGSLSQQTYTVSGGTFPRNETVSVNVSSLSDGTIRATLSFKDLVGNVTPQVSVSVAKDTVSKAVTNLKINGGDKIDHINRYMSTLTFIANELGTANYVITGPQGSPVTGTMQVTATGIQKKLGLNLSSFGISGAVTITVTFTDTPNNQGVSTVLNATIVPRF